MAATQTLENYLKAIFQAQSALPDPTSLVPVGHVASAVGVVPGTATTMVKALAESGLVRYEPCESVRLTAAGERLAALVLRRHRLVELFLAKVMGMSRAEVHDAAEHLEHTVSDRVIDRHLMPGHVVRVEERDTTAERVTLRARDDRQIAIRARAASKVLVQAAGVVLLCVVLGGVARAQTTQGTPSRPDHAPFAITDNSFLVEEAFNQEPGIFQNIFGAVRTRGSWAATFTQEWPVESLKHQLSYTLVWLDAQGHNGIGDVLVNYRYQALSEAPGRPALSPRVSVILPTGRARDGLGSGSPGLQVNLPFSKQAGDWYWHWNGGLTWLPRAESDFDEPSPTRREDLMAPFLAGSAIYRLRPMFQLMLEGLVVFDESIVARGTDRDRAFTIAPGLRTGWDIGERQLILGFAVPVTWSDGEREPGAFLYCSYELPFRR